AEVAAAARAPQLDDVRPEVGHQGGAVGAGDHPGEVENADAVEHAAEYTRAPLSLRFRSGGRPMNRTGAAVVAAYLLIGFVACPVSARAGEPTAREAAWNDSSFAASATRCCRSACC